jgi:hypothetical protein
MSLSRNGRAAMYYGNDRKLAVFGCRPGTKEPYAGGGELTATTDPETIERFWNENPDAEVAVSLRFTSLWVLDVDGRHFGDEWFAHLESLHGKVPHTPTSISGSGNPSAHYWFRRTEELSEVRIKSIAIGEYQTGIDIKGLQTGYVLLPPSRHPSGGMYRWEASSRIDEVEVADPPAWLVGLIKRQATRFSEGKEFPNPIDPETFFLGAVFKRAGLLGKRLGNGKWSVTCPNEGRHTKDSSTSSSVLFAPEKPGGRGTFFCSHTSACAEVFR